MKIGMEELGKIANTDGRFSINDIAEKYGVTKAVIRQALNMEHARLQKEGVAVKVRPGDEIIRKMIEEGAVIKDVVEVLKWDQRRVSDRVHDLGLGEKAKENRIERKHRQMEQMYGWTEQQVQEISQLLREGVKCAEIARRTGRDVKSIRRKFTDRKNKNRIRWEEEYADE